MPLTAEEIRSIIRETTTEVVREQFPDEQRAPSAWRDKFTEPSGPVSTRGAGLPGTQAAYHRRALDPTANRGKDGAPDDRGMRLAGIIMALAKFDNDVDRAAAFIEQRYHPQDAEIMQRALAAGSFADGGALIIGEVADGIVELLRPASVFRSLNPVNLPMNEGSITIRKLTGGATASYGEENEDATPSQQTTGNLVLTSKKLLTLVPVSNDLMRSPSAGADTMVRDDVVAAMAQRFDLAAIRGTGFSSTPKGLRYWAPAGNLLPANGTVNLANVTDDLRDLVLLLRSANVRMIRPGWIFSPRTELFLMTIRDGNGNYAFREEMMRGLFWGWPWKSTTQIPENLGGGGNESEIYLADWADVILGEQEGLMIDTSNEASYVESGTTKSAFSRDQTVVRAIQLHDTGMRHDASIAVMTAVLWGA